MNEKDLFCLRNLEHKSNAIIGFLVIQSILLSYTLADPNFSEHLKESLLLTIYILVAHTAVVAVGIIASRSIQNRISKLMGDLRDEIFTKQSTTIKLALIILYGMIPIGVIVMFMVK